LWRILYALAARITGLDQSDHPEDERPWVDRWVEIFEAGAFAPDCVAKYFDTYADRFDLFHPDRPFLQDPRLAGQCPKSSGVNKLVLGRPAGNGQVWFGHHDDLNPEPVPSGTAFLHLVAQLYYGPSGRCTARSVGETNEANTAAGPLRSVVSYHPVGRDLFESLMFGLLDPEELEFGELEFGEKAPDLCPWENDEPPDPLASPLPQPAGICSQLTGRFQHALLLTPSPDGETVTDARMTWAWRHKFPAASDPYLVLLTSKEGNFYPRQASADRALWRDLDALLTKNRPGTPDPQRPPLFDQLHTRLTPSEANRLRVRAYGFDQDGQTRDKQWYTATTPPVLGHLEEFDAAAPGIGAVREAAEKVVVQLQFALRKAWRTYTLPITTDKPGKKEAPWVAAAEARYWPAAEAEFWRRIEAGDYASPQRSFARLALNVYDAVTAGVTSTPRGAKSCEGARGLLTTLLSERKKESSE
jgi:CRISPR system Cascade subunit CasA